MTNEQKLKGIAALKNLKRLSLLCVAIIVFFGIVFNLGNMSLDNIKRTFVRLSSVFNSREEDKSATVTYAEDAGTRLVKFKDGVAVVTSDKLKVFDRSGIEFFSSKTVMANPCVRATDSRIMVFDRDANSIGVYTSFACLSQIKTDQKIINASMSDQGAIAVASQADGYKSMVTLYNPNFDKIYEYYSADGYILNTAVYGKGKAFACSALVVDESGSFCALSVFDTSEEQPVCTAKINAGFVFDLQFLNKSKLLAVADTGWYVIDARTGDIINSREYSSASLLGYSTEGTEGVFVFSANSNSSQLKIYDFLADTEKSAEVQGKVKSIAFGGGKIVVLAGNKLQSFDRSGNLESIQNVQASQLVAMAEGNTVIVSHGGSINYIKLTGEEDERSA